MSSFRQPPSQARSVGNLAALTAAVEQVLREKPCSEISVNDLARAAGVSPAYLYTRFENKRALLDHVIDAFLERQKDAVKLLFIKGKWSQGLEGRLTWLGSQFKALLQQHRGKIRALSEMGAGEDRANAWRELTAGGYVRDWLLACRGEIRHPDPERAVTMVLQLLALAMQSGAQHPGAAVDVEDVVRMALLFLIHAGPDAAVG